MGFIGKDVVKNLAAAVNIAEHNAGNFMGTAFGLFPATESVIGSSITNFYPPFWQPCIPGVWDPETQYQLPIAIVDGPCYKEMGDFYVHFSCSS